MPGFNGTGPRGQGPGSGWGMGPCGAGRRMGFARGGGRGAWGGRAWGGGRGYWGRPRWSGAYGSYGPGGGPAYGSPQDEAQALKEEVSYLQSELAAVNQRLAELEGA
ncbi:MAG: DUF5320 domain-containing protein [Desulfobaccales bacterium]